jgi:hypothetical protein
MYLLEKIIMSARNHTLMRWHERAGGVFDFAGLARSPRSIGFDTSNARHVHIGDQIFLEPVMRACRDRGVQVVVAPSAHTQDYFRDAGYVVGDSARVLEQELRVAPVFMYDFIPRRERSTRFLYLSTIDHHIDAPVSAHLARHVLAAACLDPDAPPVDGRPHLVSPGPTALDGEAGQWIAFSDVVDSGWFRVTAADRRVLARIAQEKRRQGYRIVRVGSAAERERAPEPLGFEDLDLRGRTSVVELFRLLRSPNVVGTISFDTVVGHMGIACGKDAVIRIRHFVPSHSAFIKRHLIPPFIGPRPSEIRYV